MWCENEISRVKILADARVLRMRMMTIRGNLRARV